MKWILLIMMAMVACDNSNKQHMETYNCIDIIEKNIENFASVQYVEDCDYTELKKKFNLNNENSISTSLGADFSSLNYWEVMKDEENHIYVTIWEKEGNLAKLDLHQTWNKKNVSKEDISDLGTPAKKLTYFYGDIKMKKKAWIYPEKGIAVFFGFGKNTIYRVSYFQKTTMEVYENTLHPVEEPREFEYNTKTLLEKNAN